MVSLFKTFGPATIAIGILYAILVNLNLFNLEPYGMDFSSGPLSHSFFSMLNTLGWNQGFQVFSIYVILLVIQAFTFNRIFNHFRILHYRNFLALLVFITFMAMFNQYSYISASFLALTCILPGIHQLFDTNNNDSALKQSFNAAFWFSLASLFYTPTIVLILFMYISFAILMPFYWRYWLAALVSFFVPYFLLFTWHFAWDTQLMFFSQLNPFTSGSIAWPPFELKMYIQMFLLLFTLAISFGFQKAKFFSGSIQIRKFYQVFMLFIPISLLAFIFTGQWTIDPLILILISLSAFFTFGLYMIKQAFWAELTQAVMVLSIVIFHFIDIKNLT